MKLHVHHLTYARIFKEDLADLMALCRPHHTKIEMMITDRMLHRFGDVVFLRSETLRLLQLTYSPPKKREPKKKAQRPQKLEKLPSWEIKQMLMADAAFVSMIDSAKWRDIARSFRNHPRRSQMIANAEIIVRAHRGIKTGEKMNLSFPRKATQETVPIQPIQTDQNVESVRQKLFDRMQRGISKYGVTTERGDLTTKQWLIHAQEEALDLAVYLEKLIQQEP